MRGAAITGLFILLWSGTAAAQLGPVQRAGLTNIDYMMLDRELTLDAGVIEFGGRVQTVQIDAGLFSISATGLAATVGYGIANVVEIWGEPVLLIDPQTELGLNLGTSVRAVNSDVFDMAPSVIVPINVTGPGDKVASMSIGLDSRIRLGSVASLLILHGLVNPIFAGTDQVVLMANLGLGLQLAKVVGLRFETRPLAIATSTGKVISYGDVVPFGFDFLFNAASSFDCFLGIAFPDLGHAGDFYAFTIGAMGRR